MFKLCYRFVCVVFFTSCVFYTQAQATSPNIENEATEAPATLIAVATEQMPEIAEIHAQISQAPYFLLFNHEGVFLRSLSLPTKAQGNIGEVSKFLVQQQVTVLIAAHYDENDLNSLTAHDIIPIERQGSAIDEVVRLLQCEPNPPADLAVEASSKVQTPTAPAAPAQ